MKIKILFFVLIVILLSGCEARRYSRLVSLYDEGKYVVAIESIDQYMEFSSNGAYKTRAEQYRSRCYYELAKRAFSQDNLKLTVRFSKLSNSVESDTLLALCYKMNATSLFSDKQDMAGFTYYDKILTEVPTSRFVPEILYKKMNYLLIQGEDNYNIIWDIYKDLHNKYRSSEYYNKSELLVNRIQMRFLEEAQKLDIESCFEKLFDMNAYPVGKRSIVRKALSNEYILRGDTYMRELEFSLAERDYKYAVYYDEDNREKVKNRMLSSADKFIDKGREYVSERNFKKAYSLFSKTFNVIPNYKKAIDAIEEAKDFENTINKARLVAEKADNMSTMSLRLLYPELPFKASSEEKHKYEKMRFSRIAEFYHTAYNIDNLPLYKEKETYARNLVKRYTNPDKFAKEIVGSYNNGIVSIALDKADKYVKSIALINEEVESNWNILVTSSQNRFEVDYIVSNNEKRYSFKWIVNLYNKEIKGMNQLSKSALEGIFLKNWNEEEEFNNEDK